MKGLTLTFILSLLLASLSACSPFVQSGATPTPLPPSIPLSSYEPQPGDAKLQPDQVYINVENSRVVIEESMPAQVSLVLNGNLSDPCHKLRVVVTPADTQKEIRLDAYSIYDPKEVCITMIQPFNATIPLGSYAGGHFTVFVNDQLVGEFDA